MSVMPKEDFPAETMDMIPSHPCTLPFSPARANHELPFAIPAHRVSNCWKRTAEHTAGHKSPEPSTHLKHSFAGSPGLCVHSAPRKGGSQPQKEARSHSLTGISTAFSLDLIFLNCHLKPSSFNTCIAVFVCFKDGPVWAGVYARM